MISKACFKSHTLFLSLPVKDCLCIDIAEIRFLSSVHFAVKKNLLEQFIRLVQTLFTLCIFPKARVLLQSNKKVLS